MTLKATISAANMVKTSFVSRAQDKAIDDQE